MISWFPTHCFFLRTNFPVVNFYLSFSWSTPPFTTPGKKRWLCNVFWNIQKKSFLQVLKICNQWRRKRPKRPFLHIGWGSKLDSARFARRPHFPKMEKCAFWQLDGDCAPHSLVIYFPDSFWNRKILKTAENVFLAPQFLYRNAEVLLRDHHRSCLACGFWKIIKSANLLKI